MKVDRFKLEEQIQSAWNITDDLDLAYRHICDGEMTEDEIANLLLGLRSIYRLKFEELWQTFECLVGKGEITGGAHDLGLYEYEKLVNKTVDRLTDI